MGANVGQDALNIDNILFTESHSMENFNSRLNLLSQLSCRPILHHLISSIGTSIEFSTPHIERTNDFLL